MIADSTDAVVVHGTHLVYVAVLSETLCREAQLLAQRDLGVCPVLSDQVIEGIKSAGKNKDLSWPPYSANFGVTLRPQASTRGSVNSETQSIDASIGSIREGYVKTSASSFQHTFVPVVQPIYEIEFFPAFRRPLTKEDDFYGDRPSKKTRRIPRFKSNFLQRDKMHLPSPLKSSIPPCNDTVKNAVAEFENRILTTSEWILAEVFFSLPYGTTAFQAADDLQSACDYALTKGLTFPCVSLCRPLPKGTLGMYPSKPLHDDGNSCIIPSMWQSVVGHDFLNLVFVGKQMKVEIRASHQRFYWFMGWIPHKTELLGDVPMFRICHSAYSKPEMEHLTLSLLNSSCRKATVDTFST
jgi:hypothetical protein